MIYSIVFLLTLATAKVFIKMLLISVWPVALIFIDRELYKILKEVPFLRIKIGRVVND
jgi:hypothetical protein